MSDNPVNIHRAINALSLTDKELKKYRTIKTGAAFLEGDLILLYDNEFVKVSSDSAILKQKISKDNTVYRKIV